MGAISPKAKTSFFEATGFWIAPLLNGAILTLITLFESLRLQRAMPSARRSPLLRVFVRDGLLYLGCITITNLLNVAFFVQKIDKLQPSAMAFQFLISSLMSSRLVLSLRDSEATAFNSAAASIATRSFWKTSNGSNTTGLKTTQDTKNDHNDEVGLEVPTLLHTAVKVESVETRQSAIIE